MKKISFIIFGLLLSCVIFAQERIEMADQYFKQEQYSEAAKLYEKVFKSAKVPAVRRKVAFNLGESYRRTYDYGRAQRWFGEAITSGYQDPVVYFRMGEVLQKLGDFTDAVENLVKYIEKVPDDNSAQMMLKSCNFAVEMLKKVQVFDVKNEISLNTNYLDYGPNVFKLEPKLIENQKINDFQFNFIIDLYYDKFYWATETREPKEKMIFASDRPQANLLSLPDPTMTTVNSKLYESLLDKKTETWSKPQPIAGLSSQYNEGTFSYCEATKTGYFMRCGVDNASNCNIYVAQLNSDKNWTVPVLFDINDKKFDFFHPYISADGKTLYFSSNMDGGFGGFDLWKVTKSGDKWSKPINLGPTINTPNSDAYPFILGDSVLYFATTGRVGMGGWDIFYTRMQSDGTFSDPINPGDPINSSADDFGIFFKNNDEGYFTSNRISGLGQDDIYSFKRKPKLYAERGNLRDEEKKRNIKFKSVSYQTVKLKGSDGTTYTNFTDADGYYEFNDLDPRSTYALVVEAEFVDLNNPEPEKKEEPKETVVKQDTVVKDTVAKEVVPPPVIEVIKKEDIVEMKATKAERALANIYYDFDRWELKSISKRELDTLASILIGGTEDYIVINSYTDERGTEDYNLKLSQRRAQSVVDYLISKGVSKHRLSAIGYGERHPVIKHANQESEHALNRRTTFKILNYSDFAAHLAEAAKNNIDISDTSKAGVFDLTEQKTTPVEVTSGITPTSTGMIRFRVQFIATKNPINPEYYKKIQEAMPEQPINHTQEGDGFNRYQVGSYEKIKYAVKCQKQLREMGYDCFVVAYEDDNKISVSKALSIIRKKKN